MAGGCRFAPKSARKDRKKVRFLGDRTFYEGKKVRAGDTSRPALKANLLTFVDTGGH